MQMVRNILIGIVVFWFAILLFMPKQEIYYTIEKSLFKEGVELDETHLDEGMFTLKARGVTLYVQGIEVAKIEKIRFFTLLFYTSVRIDGIKVNDSFSAFVPEEISHTVLMHSLLSPLKVFLTSSGDFGLAEGEIALKERKIHIEFTDVKKLGKLRSQLTKGEKGWYYETSF